MSNKQLHPDIQLFDYLNGSVDAQAAITIAAHLSACDDCASVAGLVRALKESASEQTGGRQLQISNLTSEAPREHPDISKLAPFFYFESTRAERSNVASHVALCGSCATAIAQYARGERAAAEYKPASELAGDVPAAAWEMIRDWEDTSFGKLKPANEVLGHELLEKLNDLLNERKRADMESDTARVERVPVLIVSSAGEVRGVEYFEKAIDPTGADVLRHAEGSARFDNKPVHTLFDFGENDPFVVSHLIRRDTVRLETARPDEKSRRADYIIIED